MPRTIAWMVSVAMLVCAYPVVAESAPPAGERVVFLAGKLSDEQVITLTVAVPNHVVLFDTPQSRPHNQSFLKHYHPDRVIPLGSYCDKKAALEEAPGAATSPALWWNHGPPLDLWQAVFPRIDQVVVCPAEPRSQLLHGACLAGLIQAPLYVFHGQSEEAAALRSCLNAWQPRTVFAVADTDRLCRQLPKSQVIRLADERAVAAAYLKRLLDGGPIDTLVVANPFDHKQRQAPMSWLAPWLAVQKRAALLLTDASGRNVAELTAGALARRDLRRAESLILLGDLDALPTEYRPNPIADGKDARIEMEPLTPTGDDPFTFATGRLFHKDVSAIALLLARQRLLNPDSGPRKALIVSNPTGGLPLLEAFSRNTAKELANGGFQTTALFSGEVDKERLRRLLPEQDLFLWEGHYSTLAREYGLPDWPEPLRPSLIFLQSCLALRETKALPLLDRGGVGVIGSATRTYSASGGACSLAFFDALIYERRTVGGSLRQAKNFLLAYSLLKEKRLREGAKLSGANLRAAWAFTLWGDPTLKLALPPRPPDGLPPVQTEVRGNTILVQLPEEKHEKAISSRFKAQMLPNARLAGLLEKNADDDGQPLKPFLFTEVVLPHGRPGRWPVLHSRIPSRHWVFCWDERRCCGYLLVIPRAHDREELRFHVDWQPSRPDLKIVDVGN